MKHVICSICGGPCIKYGKNKSGSQRWFCKTCGATITPKIDNSAKQLNIFLDWLFGKEIQSDMPDGGRTFRRKTSRFWNIWPLLPVIESKRDVVFVDGIYADMSIQEHGAPLCRVLQSRTSWYLMEDPGSQKR